jgi:hypothetical protein
LADFITTIVGFKVFGTHSCSLSGICSVPVSRGLTGGGTPRSPARAGQRQLAIIAGRLTVGPSLNGAMVSSVM